MPYSSTYGYAPLLTAIVVLLALVFLVSGLVVLFSRRHRGSGHSSGVSPQSRKYAPVAALVTPTILFCFGILFVNLTTSPEPKPTLQLVNPGTLTVGVLDQSNPSPPEIYYDQGGNPMGFDIDLIKKIAKNMHLEPDIKPSKQPLGDLKNKQVDVVISAYPVDTEGNLSVPYLAPKDVLLVRKMDNSNQLEFNSWAELCGHTIGVQDNITEKEQSVLTSQSQCSLDKIMTVKDDYSSAEKLADALLKKEVDAIYQNTPIFAYYQTLSKYSNKFEQIWTSHTIQGGILIRPDNKPLCDSIKTAFDSLVNNGWYKEKLNRTDGDLTADDVRSNPVATPIPCQ